MHFTAAQMKDMRQKERDKEGEEFQRNHGKQTAGFIQQQFTSLSLSPLHRVKQFPSPMITGHLTCV